MRLDKEQLAFLARFAKSAEGKLFLQLLEGRMAERDQELRIAMTGELVFRAQGRALELADLVKTITGAPDGLARTQQSPRN